MKTIKDYECYSSNPSCVFLEDMKVISYIKKGDLVNVQNTSTGEELLMQQMGKDKTSRIDTREYRKVYVASLNTIAKLSSAGLKVWCYVLSRLIASKDEIGINMEDILQYTGYKTRANIYNGIANLLENGMLFRKTGSGSYYININIFFNGNRIK
jgi:hypothetical protein